MSVTDGLAYGGGMLLMISFLPQIYRCYRRKSAADVSVAMILSTTLSTIMFLGYSLILMLVPLIIINGLFLVSNIALPLLKVRYDRMEAG